MACGRSRRWGVGGLCLETAGSQGCDVEVLGREEGKTRAEGISETIRAAQIFDYFAGECLRLSVELMPSIRDGVDVEITREPVGFIGIITPWNFPIAIPTWKIVPAIAHGNTVIFNPAELAPGCAWALVDILHRAGLPEGVLNLVMGKGSIVGEEILASNDVDAVTFTGSVETGHHVAAECAKHLRKVQLEMGGKNPFVVLDDANLDIAVDCAINGAFFSPGQRCTASSGLVVTDGTHDRFVAALIAKLKSLKVGHALAEDSHIGPVVDENQLNQDEEYISIGSDGGANLAWGGERLTRDTPGYYLQPALFTECSNDMRICREELFGPVASVIRVRNFVEALYVANDTHFGLSSGICTSSLKHVSHFKRHAEAGMIMVNLPTAGVTIMCPLVALKG